MYTKLLHLIKLIEGEREQSLKFELPDGKQQIWIGTDDEAKSLLDNLERNRKIYGLPDSLQLEVADLDDPKFMNSLNLEFEMYNMKYVNKEAFLILGSLSYLELLQSNKILQEHDMLKFRGATIILDAEKDYYISLIPKLSIEGKHFSGGTK